MSKPLHCLSCKHWDGSKDSFHPGFGCCELGQTEGWDPTHPETLAIAADREMYLASLHTKPEFGCVQHEPKGDRDGK